MLYLESLRLFSFKNYEQAQLHFSPKMNCLVGKNGMGKTNILEAIHYLCVCKGHRTYLDRQSIRHGSDFFRLEGVFNRFNDVEKIVCKFGGKPLKKVMEKEQVAYKRLADHVGYLPVVMIAPDDVQLLNDGSEYRRQLLNFALSQLDYNYLQQLIRYNKLLSQRNTLLKQDNLVDKSLLDTYNQQLYAPAQYIFEKRAAFVTAIQPLFQRYYETLADGREKVGMEYRSHLNEKTLQVLLEESYEKDVILQRTTKGVHKDDLKFTLEGRAIKRYASQGQLKSYLIALKLAVSILLKQEAENPLAPILLLDDVFDKLDPKRVQNLLSLLMEEDFGQVFITDTDETRTEQAAKLTGANYLKFLVHEGEITPIEKE